MAFTRWLWIFAVLTGYAADNRLSPEMLWELGRVGAPVVSPDGRLAAYTVTRYAWREGTRQTDIWLVDTERGSEQRLTTHSASDHTPMWAADSQSLYFVSNRDGSSQIYHIARAGGEAVKVTDFDDAIANVHRAPKGAYWLFTRAVKLDETAGDRHPDLPNANAKRYDHLKFRHWDTWHDGTFSHVFKADKKGAQVTDLMPGRRSNTPLKPFGGRGDMAISPDGQEICYVALVDGLPAGSTDTGLYLLSADGGQPRLITKDMPGYDTDPVYSPDGRYLAFMSMATAGYESDRNRIMVYDRKTTAIRELTADRDQTIGHADWYDNQTLVFYAPTKGTYQLYALDVNNGESRQITKGRHNIQSFSMANGVIVATKSTHERPTELVRVDYKTGALTPLTGQNDDVYAKLALPKVEERWLTATDGKPLHTWVIYPPNFDPTKKYPMLTYCQGGPQGMVSQFFSYRWNFHLMAAQGYVVVAPNRRGLPGFGREWNDEIKQDYGGQAMDDLLTATDALRGESFIDKDRVAAVGASFGGYSVFMLMGRNHGDQKRFATMIAHCGMFNMESWYLSTEELFFPNRDMGGGFWLSAEQKDVYRRNSPHNFVEKWETPLMVIHNQLDYRVPLEQGLQAFTAAKLQGLDARLLYFPEENHWVLSPQNSILWHREFFTWLAKYCQ